MRKILCNAAEQRAWFVKTFQSTVTESRTQILIAEKNSQAIVSWSSIRKTPYQMETLPILARIHSVRRQQTVKDALYAWI